MATKKVETTQNIYQLKITLLGTDPPVWRRLLVPATLSLAHLHDVLQIAMGWEDCHLHEFSAGQRRFGPPDPDAQFMEATPVESERTASLSAVLQRVGAKMTYTYDFGDGWEHGIVLEKRLPLDPDITYPVCIDGRLACPPEDCGGVFGFSDLLEALTGPKNEHQEELLEWIGDDYDPQAFSVDEVNQQLSPKRRRGKASRN